MNLPGKYLQKNSVLFFVLLLYIFISVFKVNFFLGRLHFNYNDDSGFFWDQSALRYRYTKMVALGTEIPKIDYQIQYPEGLEVAKEFPLLPEYAFGLPYKWLTLNNIVPLHVYIFVVSCFFSSLSVFIIYLFSKKLWSSTAAGLFSAIIYSFSIPSFWRLLSTYSDESFALPFIFFSLSFFIFESPLFVILASLSILISLLSWHLSTFYFVIFVLIICLKALITYPNNVVLIKRSLFLFSLIFASSLGFVFLRSKQFYLSPGLILLFSLLCSHLIATKLQIKKRTTFGLIFISFISTCLLITNLSNPAHIQTYSHVYNLLKFKLLYWGIKPANPTLLPPETRIYWVGPFESAKLIDFVDFFFPFIFILLISLPADLYRQIKSKKLIISFSSYQIIVFFFLIFMVLYFYLMRMSVFLIFFVCLLAGKTIVYFCKKKHSKKILFYFLIIFTLYHICHTIYYSFKYTHEEQSWLGSEQKLLEWIKKNTKAESVFGSPYFSLEPFILAYADRKIIMHSGFESVVFRKKTYEIMQSIFLNEKETAKMAEKYGLDYLILHQYMYYATHKYSQRYITNNLDHVNHESVVYKSFVDPNKLVYFEKAGEIDKYVVLRYKK